MDSEGLSLVVVQYLNEHSSQTDGALIRALTSSQWMPKIDVTVAIDLLRTSIKHKVVDEDGPPPLSEDNDEGEDEKEDELEEDAVQQAGKKRKGKGKAKAKLKKRKAAPKRKLKSLRTRCVDAVRFDARAAFEHSTLDGLPADVSIELLQGALDIAHKESDADDSAIAELRTSQGELKSEVKELQQTKRTLEAQSSSWRDQYYASQQSLQLTRSDLTAERQSLQSTRAELAAETLAYQRLKNAVQAHNNIGRQRFGSPPLLYKSVHIPAKYP